MQNLIKIKRPYIERLLLWLLGGVTLILLIAHFRNWFYEMPMDLRAFYAGGKVVASHHDPYLVQPLLQIEQQIVGRADHLSIVLPTPLPGYDLLAFSALSYLPAQTATLLYGILTCGALGLITFCLERISPLPRSVAFAATFFGVAYESMTFGQMLPFVAASLIYGAVLLREGKPQRAAIMVSFSLMQPQLGALVALCCFLFVPKMRLILGILVCGLIGTSLSLGLPLTREYLQVVSMQARSEVGFPGQYSLSWLVHDLGLSTNGALLAGALSTLLLAGICIGILARHRQAAIESGAIILLPAAFVVLGGTYQHAHQVAVALLAAIVLHQPAKSWFNPAIAAAALIILYGETADYLPHWPSKTTIVPIVFSMITAWAVVYYLTTNTSTKDRLKQASFATLGLSAYFLFLITLRPPLQHLMLLNEFHPVHIPSMLASVEWMNFVNAKFGNSNQLPFFLFVKAPIWAALVLTLINASQYLKKRPEVA